MESNATIPCWPSRSSAVRYIDSFLSCDVKCSTPFRYLRPISPNTERLPGGEGSAGRRKTPLVKWSRVCTPKNQGGLGIRTSREMNQALLAKLGWKLSTNEQALWARIIRAKYLNETNFLVRNGTTARFWMDTWLGTKQLIHHATSNLSVPELQSTVNQYWVNGDWNWIALEHKLPQEIILLLQSFSFDPDCTDGDIPYWIHTPDGLFSTKSAYFSMVQENGRPVDKKNSQRARRNMIRDPSCNRCGAREETVIHAFRDCPTSMNLWRQWTPATRLTRWRNSSLQEWIAQNLNSRRRLEEFNLSWDGAFSAICWHIWLGRNHHIFRQDEDWIPNNRNLLDTTSAYIHQDQCGRFS